MMCEFYKRYVSVDTLEKEKRSPRECYWRDQLTAGHGLLDCSDLEITTKCSRGCSLVSKSSINYQSVARQALRRRCSKWFAENGACVSRMDP